jgi:C-methyltransferase C-terminal domain/Putative zinc binding domain
MVSPRCRGCGEPGVTRAVDLGPQPASDDFPAVDAPGPDARWPLELWWCPSCALVQLGPVQPLLEEPVRAVESRTSRQHARRVVTALLADHPELAGRPVREFASHHGGSWLEALAGHGCRVAEPGEPAQLVVDAHALAHEPDVQASLARRVEALAPDGLLVLEHHHLLPLVEQGQFDTIRHGHWSYLSLTAMARLAPRHGLQVLGAVAEPVFGGSLRVVLGHTRAGHRVDGSVPRLLARERAAGLADGSGLESFGRRARESAAALHAFLTEQRAAGHLVLGYGAPSKAAILLGLSGVGPELLEFTVDAAPLKHGLAIPGGRVPIRPVPELAAARPELVLVLTWDIADEVVAQLEDAGGWGARYVLPLPAPHVLPRTESVAASP